ncbi:GAF and ANTAR domain-containing protein [Actinoplanes teichomyceticus]|uniref:GAF domain-containing protein n=1 Tax=Actinoplanes teichomyceticus TaxID=1867 RepID=A0A561WA79_ACTTI|nr:GAF and ANTAR domain-containing protein [Actinoplanes teichomyceticus]TWG20770.1 GAF domain-containing protein [Actinoplanes teichomyceticus]GIF14426.1 transcriptional regulator [Actinoplanes teichomyceticus]
MTPDPLDPTAAFRELSRINLGETDMEGVLSTVAGLAQRAVPGARDVSVTLIGQKRPRTIASTSETAMRIDGWQYEHGRGPCLDASRQHITLRIDDVVAERRWPGWSEHTAGLGMHSTFSVGLPIREQISGAFNVYAGTAHAFDDDAVLLAETFAGYAAVALTNAHLYDTTVVLTQHMQAAMESRAVIEQAKGIIMGQRHCTADEAFAILSRASQDANRKLREVAADLVDRAQRPS